jgi:hypothetical protein
MIDNFVRETLYQMRHVTHSRETELTWRDMRQLFYGKIDERIIDHEVWTSRERFTWLVGDISTDQSLDFKIDSQNNGGRKWFTVNLAECYFLGGGEKYVLSMGAGTESHSQNLFLTFYRQHGEMLNGNPNFDVVWKCQICIHHRDFEWEAGTISLSKDEDGKACIGSLHMISNNGTHTDNVYMGGDGKTPEYSKNFRSEQTSQCFYWSLHTKMIWDFAFYRDRFEPTYVMIEDFFLCDFPTHPFFYAEGDPSENPNNVCSIAEGNENRATEGG